MYRIAVSHQDRHRITPRRRDTALSIDEAIGKVRGMLPGADLAGLTEQKVAAEHQRVNDFRVDTAAPEGGTWRVVIAPMM